MMAAIEDGSTSTGDRLMADFEWLIGERVILHKPGAGADSDVDGTQTVDGVIREVRDDSPWEDEQHIRVVVDVDGQLVDASKDAIKLK